MRDAGALRYEGEIASMLFLSDAAVRIHVGNIFADLGFSPADENRRVRAILLLLQNRP